MKQEVLGVFTDDIGRIVTDNIIHLVVLWLDTILIK